MHPLVTEKTMEERTAEICYEKKKYQHNLTANFKMSWNCGITFFYICGSEHHAIPNGRIRLIQLPLGVLVLVSQFCLLGVDEFNICGSEHHAYLWPYTAYVLLMMGEIVARNM